VFDIPGTNDIVLDPLPAKIFGVRVIGVKTGKSYATRHEKF
jgi:hypothetical protein